ncbi:4Fe-4S cluster-binding protein [Thermococcus kodakarensis KOD1]|uniref:4Fe-4S cluster-binding protein n=2 Tax=Thermococcus TaxID=2263 RepID=Q5JHV8_THEKO|nr:4Fe-4S cluster-binding protein [Thermococcus kodakarensis KOD1]
MPETLKCSLIPLEHLPNGLGVPQIDPELCIGCGACVNVCPAGALQAIDDYMEGIRKISLNIGKCTPCTRCEEVCPTGAIKIATFEVISLRKRAYVEVVELRLHLCPGCGNYADYTERSLEKSLQMLSEGMFDRDEIVGRAVLCRSCRRKLTVNETMRASREG